VKSAKGKPASKPRPAKPRPLTGEPRRVHQPLKIDLLPQSARDAIEQLYDRGRTWMEIEEQSARPYSEKWQADQGGFVNWEALDLKVLEAFPDMKLPKSTLHRWFDLRVRQARRQVLAESAKARAFAAQFVPLDLPGGNAAVMNAMRDQVFNLMQKVGSGDQAKFLEALNALSLTMARLQRVDLQARRVAVDEKEIQMKLDLVKQKAQSLIGSIESGDGKKGAPLTREELLEKVREIYGAV
jgi:hypothetical protein